MAGKQEDGGWEVADVIGILANPFYAIKIDPLFATDHEPILSEEDWIAANQVLIRDLGPNIYLRNLLAILKGNYVSSTAGPDADPFGYTSEDVCDHAEIAVDVLDRYIATAIGERLEREPLILARSIAALRGDETVDRDIIDEVHGLEQDPEVVGEAISLTAGGWGAISDDARRLVVLYLIDSITVGAPHLPLHEQVTIEWRVPTADG